MSARHVSGKRLVAAAAVPLAVLASGALVWQSSYAAFSASSTNAANSWSAGTVAISDDDSATAMFSASGLKPGSTGSKCIAVTSSGSLPSAVKLYGTSYATTNALASSLNLTVDEGTGGSFNSCGGFSSTSNLYSGTLAAFGTTKTSYATGVGTWAPTGSAPETKIYKITWTLSPSSPDSAQGGTAGMGFTWEAQNS